MVKETLHDKFFIHALHCEQCKNAPLAQPSYKQCEEGSKLLLRHYRYNRPKCSYCGLEKTYTIAEMLEKIKDAMLKPLKVKLDYEGIGRKLFIEKRI